MSAARRGGLALLAIVGAVNAGCGDSAAGSPQGYARMPYYARCAWPDGGAPVNFMAQHFEVSGSLTTLTKASGARVFVNNAPCVIEER